MPRPDLLYAPDAEDAVLATILAEPACLPIVSEILGGEEVFSERRREVFRGLQALADAGEPITAVALAEALRVSGDLERVGGVPALFGMLDLEVPASKVEGLARIVRDRAQLRRLRGIAQEILALTETGRAAVEVQEQAEAWIYAAGEGVGEEEPMEHIRVPLQETFERLEANTPDVLTGFRDLDAHTLGMPRGDLIIVAARPSMGKTAIALQMAVNVAAGAGEYPPEHAPGKQPVAIFSLEMSREAITRRMLFTESRVDGVEFRRKPRDDDYPRLAHGAAILNGLPLYIHNRARTVRQVRAQCRRLLARKENEGKRLGLVVIDYLGKMRGSGAAEKRVHELGEITGDLKDLAKEFDVPVVLLCQLSRKVEERPNKEPMMSDLRDSGEIEQDADGVLLLYRPEYYHGPVMRVGSGKGAREINVEGKAKVIVGKWRNGKTGAVDMAFIDRFTRFEDLSPREAR